MEKKGMNFFQNWFVSLVIAYVLDRVGIFLIVIPLNIVTAGATIDAVIYGGMSFLADIGIYITCLIYYLIVKCDRALFSSLSWKSKGNSIVFIIIGIVTGLALNFLCVIIATFSGDLSISSFYGFEAGSFFYLLFAIFVAASAEEIICRVFLYNRIYRTYKNVAFAVIVNSLFFAGLHIHELLKFGFISMCITLLSMFLSGVFFSLFIYYWKSVWACFALHTAWNFMQGVILGTSVSGTEPVYSLFDVEVATQENSFAFNLDTGVEGTVVCCLVFLCAIFIVSLIGSKTTQKSALWQKGFWQKETTA